MALFKISKGLRANLPAAKVEGNCWWTIDDSKFFIDYKDENGTLQRKALNAQDADTVNGHIVEADVSVITTDQIDAICGAKIYAGSEVSV